MRAEGCFVVFSHATLGLWEIGGPISGSLCWETCHVPSWVGQENWEAWHFPGLHLRSMTQIHSMLEPLLKSCTSVIAQNPTTQLPTPLLPRAQESFSGLDRWMKLAHLPSLLLLIHTDPKAFLHFHLSWLLFLSRVSKSQVLLLWSLRFSSVGVLKQGQPLADW